jgi:Mannosyltransferase OCH1 and related enzymes
MIPKVIHYCWFGGKSFPAEVKKCIQTWKEFCPDFEIVRWDESNIDVNMHPFIKAAYNAKAWAFVSDYARLKIIYEHGGIYLDTDVELLKSLDKICDNECFVAEQQASNYINTGIGFGAIPQHFTIMQMLKEYDSAKFELDHKNFLSCPILNTMAFQKLGFSYSSTIQKVGDVTVYPPEFFDPLGTGKGTKYIFSDNTVSVHHYDASWTNGKQRLRRKIIRILGPQVSCKIRDILHLLT